MATTPQTLIEINHPVFRKSYQDGRKYYFQDAFVLTDKHLMECLQSVFEEEKEEKDSESLYYAVGHLIGQISGCVIPLQPYEDDTERLQEAFLVKVGQMYGAEGSALLDTIRQFWAMQDQLAQTLEADVFVQMIKRGVEQESF